MSKQSHQCPQCEAPLRPEDSQGLCTRCLLELALGNNSSTAALPMGGERKDGLSEPSGDAEEAKASEDDSLPEGLIGKTLGEYAILEVLGQGGMGVIYKARQEALNRLVALKVLAPRFRGSLEFAERFRREAQSVARLSHPNIVPIHSIGEQRGRHYFAMEYVRGVNLAEYLKKQGNLRTKQALNLAIRVASALEAAHAEGIIHRDIKPQNIMIDTAGRVRVLDFGLAKLMDPQTLATTGKQFFGTPSYVSPEQCENKILDERTDLYSLGIVLFECLAGRLPYSAESSVALLKKILFSPPPALGKAIPGIAPEVDGLVRRLMAKDPADRFRNATELIKRIEEIKRKPLVESGEVEGLPSATVFLVARAIGSDGGKQPAEKDATEAVDKTAALFQECLRGFGGAEVEVTDEAVRRRLTDAGFAAAFEAPLDAIRCALAFQDKVKSLETPEGPKIRMAIHEGEASRLTGDLTPPQSPEELAAQALDTAVRIMDLAAPGQILLTHRTFNSARREKLSEPGDSRIVWLSHGPYRFENLDESMEVFEVGLPKVSPLAAPQNTKAARSATRAGDELTLGWRPAIGLEVPNRSHWHLEESLGVGGFGEVWTARHAKTKDRRVFKFCFESDLLRSLKREVTLLRLIKETLGNRDDISNLLDWNFDKPPFYVESEYTEGGNLKEWANAQGGIANVPMPTRLELVAQSAAALAAAHSVGVIHKDVKTSNILVGKDLEGRPRAVLADFGVGSVTDSQLLAEQEITILTELHTGGTISMSGTRLYMAPEILEGKGATTASDIYALGIVLYQVVSGDLSKALAPGWERNVEDELLREDIAACVDHNPDLRLPSAMELARNLRNIEQRRAKREAERQAEEEARLSHEREKKARAELERARRRNRTTAVFSALGIAFLLVAAGTVWWFQTYRRNQAESALARESLLREEADEAREEADQAREEAELALYHSNIMLAASMIEENRRGQANELLQESPRRFRNWEWARLYYVCNLDILTFHGHEENITAVNFSPDGRRVVSAGADHTARIWKAETGEEILKLAGHEDVVSHAAFSPDGRRVATASADKTARIWDAETGRVLATLKGHGAPVVSVAFHPDGRRVLTASRDKTARIWDAETGRQEMAFEGHIADLNFAAFSPGGGRVATASCDKTAKIWDAESGRPLATLEGHTDKITSIFFSPDGRRVLTASREHLGIWNAESGEAISLFKAQTNPIACAAFSPDGRRVATASQDRIARIWDTDTWSVLFSLRGHGERVNWIAFDPDGDRVVTGSADKTARIWDAARDRETLHIQAHGAIVMRAAFSPVDGRVLTVCSKENTARVWDADTGAELLRLKGHSFGILTAAFSPDGRRIATGGFDKTVRIWDAYTGRLELRLEGHTADISASAFSPDNRLLATGASLAEAIIWDAKTGDLLRRLRGHTEHIKSIAFSPDGARVVTASTDKTARIWDPETGREIRILTGHLDMVYAAAFSPDGRRVVTASTDKTARIWDANTGRHLLTLTGHTREVLSAEFSPDGRRIATASTDGTVKIWDAETGREFLTLKGHVHGVRSVAFSPDGRKIVTASSGGKVIVWETLPLFGKERLDDADYEERIRRYKINRFKTLREKRALPPVFAAEDREENRGKDPLVKETCAKNFRIIHNAFVRYRNDHDGQMPVWLSVLVPEYLSKENLLCPTNPKGISPRGQDPNFPCSYVYMFSEVFVESDNMTNREMHTLLMKEYGDIVPAIRCYEHGELRLNLGYGGHLYWSPGNWEDGPREDYVPPEKGAAVPPEIKNAATGEQR